MTKVNLVIGEADTLATGTESNELTDTYGSRYQLAVELEQHNVIGGDFRELDRQLRRTLGTSSNWNFYAHPNTGGTKRRYVFRDRAVTLEDVSDKKASQPSGVAALVGKDPYTTPGDIDFLYEGDRFRAERSRPGGRKEVVYGTATMAGNAVSEHYGWLTFEANGETRAAEGKRKAYESTDKAYINVHFDHREPGYYDDSIPYRQRRGSVPEQEYVPSGKGWPNESLRPRDGWKIWVLPEVATRKTKALADAKKAADKVKAERDKEKAVEAVKAAQAALAKAEQALAKLS